MPALSQQPRQHGMQQAIRHAQSVDPEWRENAVLLLRLYMRRFKGDPFTSEMVVAWARSKGFESPTDNRAWGQVFKSAFRSGLIDRVEWSGYSTARGVPIRAWRKA